MSFLTLCSFDSSFKEHSSLTVMEAWGNKYFSQPSILSDFYEKIKDLQGKNLTAMDLSPGVLETADQGDREAFQKAKILYKSCMNESESLLVLFLCSMPNVQPERRSIWYLWNRVALSGTSFFKWWYRCLDIWHGCCLPSSNMQSLSFCMQKTAIHFILSKAIQSNSCRRLMISWSLSFFTMIDSVPDLNCKGYFLFFFFLHSSSPFLPALQNQIVFFSPLSGLIEQRDSLPLLEVLTMVGDWPVASADWNNTKGNTVPGRGRIIYCTEVTAVLQSLTFPYEEKIKM